MKKSKKIALAVAAVFFATGLVLCAIAFGSVGFRWERLSTVGEDGINRVTTQYNAGDFKKILLEMDIEDVEIGLSPDAQIHLGYTDRNNLFYTVSQEGGTLSVSQESEKKVFSFDWISFDLRQEDRDMTLLIPKDFDGDLQVRSDVGDVQIEGISLRGDLDCAVETGSIEMDNIRANNVKAHCDLGDVQGENMIVSQLLSLTCGAGNASIERAETAELSARSDLGDVEVEWVTAEQCHIQTEMGDVYFESLTTFVLTAIVDVGDIHGTIVGAQGEYTILADADVGRSNLDDQRGTTSRELNIKSKMGDIDIDFIK